MKLQPRRILGSFLLILAYVSTETSFASKPMDVDPGAKRAAFRKLIDRPRVPLSPETQELGANAGLSRIRFSFAADSSQRVPGVLLKRTNQTGRRPVIIALHGTGGNKESQLPLLKDLAGAGFIGIAIDGRYH